MIAPSIWITRPEPGNERTTRVLAGAGYTVIGLPVLRVTPVLPGDFPHTRWPDWLLLVSANAVRGLQAMGAVGMLPDAEERGSVRVAAVGNRTAREARAAGWTVEWIPHPESAEGLLAELATQDMDGRTVWIPSGNREGSARQQLPRELRSRGAQVEVFPVYETRDRKLAAGELVQLDQGRPGAVLLHSPSAARAVFAGEVPEAVRRWQGVPVLCIGAATAACCRDLGLIQILECESPSDHGILQTLGSIPSLGPERNPS